MTSLQFLPFALRVTLNVLRFRNEQASQRNFYFVFIIVIKKITDPQNSPVFGPPCTMLDTHLGLQAQAILTVSSSDL